MRATRVGLTRRQEQILLGGLLGDGCLMRQHRGGATHYAESHTEPQRAYIEWKALELASLGARLTSWQPQGRNRQWYLTTRANPALDSLYARFYWSGRREPDPGAMVGVATLALAVWLMDDGAFNVRQRYVTLATDSWPFATQERLALWFETQFDIRPAVQYLAGKNTYRLRFRQSDSLALLLRVRPYLHPLFVDKWRLDDPDTFRAVLTKGETLVLARERRAQLIRDGVLTVGYHTGTIRVSPT